ncbi:LysR substrate-binding domain-containing protein [Buchnera aphidicola (Neophyllaphis varicolor)]|uniref:LysR substrate-binding domain-containing protein n=1 Tax=Buchnera aphidicola TaxID=9 RepID=UPI0031B8894D
MIKIKNLKTLQAVKKSGSISEAAKILNQTQSAISHQFNILEKKLGFNLFQRKTSPIKFTYQGKILLNLAEIVLPKINKALQECMNKEKKTIRISIECHSCIQWLVKVLKKFKIQWPKIAIDFKSNMTFNPQPQLKKAKLDIIFTSEILNKNELKYIPIFDFEVKLILSPIHYLAKAKKDILPNDIALETFMIYPIPKNRLDIWRVFLKPSNIFPIFKTVDNTLLLIQMVSANMGITALPYWTVKNFEKQGLIVTKKIGKNGIRKTLYAAVLKNQKLNPIVQDFIKFTKIYTDNIN